MTWQSIAKLGIPGDLQSADLHPALPAVDQRGQPRRFRRLSRDEGSGRMSRCSTASSWARKAPFGTKWARTGVRLPTARRPRSSTSRARCPAHHQRRPSVVRPESTGPGGPGLRCEVGNGDRAERQDGSAPGVGFYPRSTPTRSPRRPISPTPRSPRSSEPGSTAKGDDGGGRSPGGQQRPQTPMIVPYRMHRSDKWSGGQPRAQDREPDVRRRTGAIQQHRDHPRWGAAERGHDREVPELRDRDGVRHSLPG